MAKANTQIYQLKITLRDINPPIWRRIKVKGDITISKLHEYIQVFMGWENYHMHEFRVKGKRYGMPDPQLGEMFDDKIYNDKKFKLCQLVSEDDVFEYEYDFGDSWRHEIKVEKILAAEKGVSCPICLAGERACPPEDCGGPWGYEQLLEILKDPEHEEYEDYREWAGDDFDSERFDVDKVNS